MEIVYLLIEVAAILSNKKPVMLAGPCF